MMTGGAPLDVPALLWLIGMVVLYFAVTVLIGWFLFPLIGRFVERAWVAEFDLSMLLVISMLYAVIAELMGMHFILGAFVAGLFISPATTKTKDLEAVKQKISGVTYGFFAPVFFASIGLHVTFDAVVNIPLFLALLLFVAFAGKVLGSGLPAYWLGLSRGEALAVYTVRHTASTCRDTGHMNMLNLENPLFQTYAVAAALMGLKLMIQGWVTVVQMMKNNGGFLNPEDQARGLVNPDPQQGQLEPVEAVERSRRMQRNDLENIPAFWVMGFLFILTEPSLWLAKVLCYGFVITRLLHFWAYATGKSHEIRATFFTVGSIIIIVMAVIVLLAVL